MAGLDPAIHVFCQQESKTWITGTSNKPGDDGLCLDEALIIFQQPLDVIEFDLRALRIGEAAAEFFQNAANPLHIDFTGDLHRVIIAVFVPLQPPSERIRAIGTALLPADAITGTVALSLIALLHRLRETLGALAQRIQRAALRIHRAI